MPGDTEMEAPPSTPAGQPGTHRRARRGALPRGRWFTRTFKVLAVPVRVVTYKLGNPPTNRLLLLITLPYFLIRFAVMLPVLLITVALFLVLLVAGIVTYLPMTIMYMATTTATLEFGTTLPDALLAPTGEAEPGPAADPRRDRELKAGAALIWSEMQRSYMTNDADFVRPVMADANWRVHRTLLSQRRLAGVARTVDAQLTGAEVESIGIRGAAQVATVRLTCQGRCFEHAPASGEILRGTDQDRSWNDHMVLRRSSARADAPTSVAPTDECPNCGAPLKLAGDGGCTTCGSVVEARPDQWVVIDFTSDAW
jgi:hypothetical protein